MCLEKGTPHALDGPSDTAVGIVERWALNTVFRVIELAVKFTQIKIGINNLRLAARSFICVFFVFQKRERSRIRCGLAVC